MQRSDVAVVVVGADGAPLGIVTDRDLRAKVVAALETIRHYDLGGGLEVSYSPTDHSGIDFADLSIISDGRFKR